MEDDMTEGEIWQKHKEAAQKKRWQNVESSLAMLKNLGIKYETLDVSTAHYRIGDFSFWPTTGKFYNPKNGVKGRGVRNLIKLIK